MFNKLLLIIFATSIGTMISVTQADVRTNISIETIKTASPAAEKKCLEAFVKSNFTYAHQLCLSLAKQGMRDAQLVTGLLYVFGQGTAKNPALAKMWLREASHNGSKEARQVLTEFNLAD